MSARIAVLAAGVSMLAGGAAAQTQPSPSATVDLQRAPQAPVAKPAGSPPAAGPAASAPSEPRKANTPAADGSDAPAAQPAVAVGATALPRAIPEDRGPHDLSPWSMFMSADIIVKAVMVSLMFASLITWTVLFGKTIELFAAGRRLRGELKRVGEARGIAEARLALKRGSLLADLIAAAAGELDMSDAHSTRAGIRERSESRFADLVRAEMQGLRRGMGLLATIGSTAPFVGLFGTVWGIMNSFIGISKSQTTNLAVVAPGIAEALLATATGLIAAIPAVIIYNHFSRGIRRHQMLINRVVGCVTRILSRELDGGQRIALRAAE